MKPKKLLLLGKSASGKDTLRNMLLTKGLRPAISYTTRPCRPGEKDGKDYHFITLAEFDKLEEQGFFIEAEPFKVATGDIWKYGKSYKTIEDGDVFIATPSGASNMLKKVDRDMFWVVEVEAREAIRFERSISRGDNRPEVNRRMKADAIDFSKPRDFKVDEILVNEKPYSLDSFIENYLRTPPLYEPK